MSAVEGPDPHREIIIVRRGGHDDDDHHHGGVWKIAFADFMTAMMCFFLVMWLINAANEQTRAALASYFNPIKLTDRNASRKGIEDIGEGPSSPEETSDNNIEDPAEVASGAGPKLTGPSLRNDATETASGDKHTDEHLFSNPYAVLAEIAKQTGTMQNISAKGEGGAQNSGPATGASGGESFRDPFAPDFWSQQVIPDHETPPADAQAADEMPEMALERSAVTAPEPETEAGATADSDPPPPAGENGEDEVAGSAAPADAPDAGQAASASPPVAEDAPGPAAQAEPEPQAPEAPPQVDPEARSTAEAIREAIAREFGASEKIVEGMSVEATPDGVLISVTDQLDFGMFEIGSAVPRRDLVLAMEKISRIISAQPGNIKINGHTDGRPFSSDTYDNWRLSTARAHSAYYMLVRGGLDEKRIVEVAGFADRKLKVAGEPYADANRRIEILLEAGG